MINSYWEHLARIYPSNEIEERLAERNLYVSSTIIRDSCDVIWYERDEIPSQLYHPLPRGTTVHINSKHLLRFIQEILPILQSQIVLVTGCDTISSNVSGYKNIINSPNILHWYLQNYALDPNLTKKRVTCLPLGIDYHKLDPDAPGNGFDMGLPSSAGNQHITLQTIRDTIPPLSSRPPIAYGNFHLNMDTFLRDPQAKRRYHAREEALDVLKSQQCCYFETHQIPRNEVWRQHRYFAFELSPHGNGLDCHRTWEALILKTIPIVKRSSIDPLYKGLPVVIVNNWSEVNTKSLKYWQKKYKNVFDDDIPAIMYSNYWANLIKNHAT